jgi:hypothetical protein
MTGAYSIWLQHTGLKEHTEYEWSIQDYRSIQNMTGGYRI